MSDPTPGSPPAERLQQIRQLIDRLLVADVFLVLAGALWFTVAVLLHGWHRDGPLLLFQRLWQPLFTPAISLLMAAALISGALGWWQRRAPR
jgi:predicted membrane channel-forming protein YqfA (hemolysin III family)